MPDEEPMAATLALLLLHVPPLVVFDKTEVPPRHTFGEPLIAPGVLFTVTDLTA
jgi:hypothetical protein